MTASTSLVGLIFIWRVNQSDPLHTKSGQSERVLVEHNIDGTSDLSSNVSHHHSVLFIGSPLQFYVDYMNSGNVSAYGPGLIHGTVNKPAVFTVDTKDAGEGKFS